MKITRPRFFANEVARKSPGNYGDYRLNFLNLVKGLPTQPAFIEPLADAPHGSIGAGLISEGVFMGRVRRRFSREALSRIVVVCRYFHSSEETS
jgi:hypothetical protein